MRQGEQLSIPQYEQLREDDRFRSELSHGLVVREPRPGALHGRVVVNVFLGLHDYVLAHNLGSVEIEAGFRLSGEATVRGPDVAFISSARLPVEIPTGFWPFAPDLAIEVASPSNSLSHIQQKVLDYFEGGTRLVWVIDPQSRTALAYDSTSDVTLLREHDTLTGGEVVPGFEIRLSALLP
jgi:Uma2 family endonuclease